MFNIKFKKLTGKSQLTLKDLEKLEWADLAENFLLLYQASQKLQQENQSSQETLTSYQETIRNLEKSKENLIQEKNYSPAISNNTFTCYFCLKDLGIKEMLACKFNTEQGQLLLCNLCLKEAWEKGEELKPKEKVKENKTEEKKKLEEDLKHYEEMGLEQYLESYKQVYLNHVERLKKELKEIKE